MVMGVVDGDFFGELVDEAFVGVHRGATKFHVPAVLTAQRFVTFFQDAKFGLGICQFNVVGERHKTTSIMPLRTFIRCRKREYRQSCLNTARVLTSVDIHT